MIRHTERPILRTAPTPLFRLARLVRQNSYKVVLTGEGADEVFGGYDLFKEAKVRRFWARQPRSSWRPLLLRRLYPYLAGLQGQSTSYLGAFFKVGLDQPDDPFFSHRPRWATTAGVVRFLSDDLMDSLAGYDPIEDLRASLPPAFFGWHPLSRAQYLETAHLLPGYILSSQGDRVSMAHAVEGRFPFLDHRVAEFAAALPPRMKLRGLTEKYLLRRSLQGDLPPSIAWRPKQPYRARTASASSTETRRIMCRTCSRQRRSRGPGISTPTRSRSSCANAAPAAPADSETTWPWSASCPSSSSITSSSERRWPAPRPTSSLS